MQNPVAVMHILDTLHPADAVYVDLGVTMGSACADWPKAVIEKHDFAMMRAVLEEWCSEYNLPLEGDQANVKAMEMMDWFEFGIRTPSEMASIIRPL